MKIRIKLYGALKVDRFSDRMCEYQDGTDIASIIEQFQFPDHLLGIILVNGLHADVETVLKDGDTLSLLPVIDGG